MLEKLDNATLIDIMQSCPVGLLILDNNNTVRWMNDTLSNMLGSHAGLLHDKNPEQLDDIYRGLFMDNETVRLPATDGGEDTWLMCSSKQLEPSGKAQFLVDISDLRSLMQTRNDLENELKELNTVDEETGLPNSKALFQSLEPQVSRSRRYNNVLSIVIMRLTNLDMIKSRYGNSYSQVLLAISQMLNDQMRWADIIGRLNDSDFLMVLPETPLDAASGIADKVRNRIYQLQVPGIEIDNNDISVEFGVAEWQKGDDVGLLMMRARDMLKQHSSDAA